jgi:hypothetical protein
MKSFLELNISVRLLSMTTDSGTYNIMVNQYTMYENV